MSTFQPTRENGKSDARVVIESVKDAEPGTIFAYDALCSALSVDTNRPITTAVVRGAVRAANGVLLREHQRVLHSVRGAGYRVALASEHVTLALDRKHKADRQLAFGMLTLKQVRWDEMDENARAAHNGQLIVMGALCQAVAALSGRQDKLEALVKNSIAAASGV